MGTFEVSDLPEVDVPTALYRTGTPVEVSIASASPADRVRLVDFFAGVAGATGGRVQIVGGFRFRLIPPAPRPATTPTVRQTVRWWRDSTRPSLLGTLYA